MLDQVVRKLIEFGYERALRQQFLAASVRLGERPAAGDLGGLERRLRAARPARALRPLPDAVPVRERGGDRRRDADGGRQLAHASTCSTTLELRTVLGHEAGHILSDHVLYRTALMILLELSGAGAAARSSPGLPLMAVRMALLEWYRAAELSCDRAATLVNRDPLVTCRTMLVLAGGVSVAQARPRRVRPPGRRVRGVGARAGTSSTACGRELQLTHSLPGPAREGGHGLGRSPASTTGSSAASSRRATSSPTRARRPAPPYEHYVTRFKAIFNEFGVDKVQDKAADAASRISDWLRTDREQ